MSHRTFIEGVGWVMTEEPDVKLNFSATEPPTVDNDSDDGYDVGSYWIDITNDKAYVCVDNAVGAANWPETTGAGGGGGLDNVVEDVTPALGGNLDVNSKSIVSVAAGDIPITPHTTGNIILDGVKWPQADGSAGDVLRTNGAGQAVWITPSYVDADNNATSQTGIVSAVSTKIIMVENIDTNDEYVTSSFTADRDMEVTAVVSIQFSTAESGKVSQIRPYINDVAIPNLQGSTFVGIATVNLEAFFVGVIRLAAGEKLDFYMFHNAGSSKATSTNIHKNYIRIRETL